MASGSDNPPVIAIVGETASGKTALALKLAELYPGEVIAADSRTIYRDLDIGTAKPTTAERAVVPHHMLDVITPDQSFSAADFQRLARQAMIEIAQRSKIPYIVGGSGLYIDGLLYNFTFRPRGDSQERKRLEALTVPELQALLADRDIPLPRNAKNPRHLIRYLETGGVLATHTTLRQNTLIIGLCAQRDELTRSLERRVDAMIDNGFVSEVTRASKQYGWDAPGLQAPGYRAFKEYLNGHIGLDEAKRQFVQNDLRLAKRQRTWFKRNKDINWISSLDECVDLVTTFLNK